MTSFPLNVTATGINDEPVDQSIERLKEVGEAVWRYCSPVILGAGTLGNLIVLVLTPRLRRFSQSLRCIIMTLAACDLGVLWTGLLRYTLRFWGWPDVRQSGDVACRLHTFFTYFFTHASGWVLVLMSLERLICVVFPVLSRRVVNMRATVISIAAVGIALALINSSFFWAIDDEGTCPNRLPFSSKRTWPLLDFFIASFLPFLIMVVCSAAIIAKLRRQTKRVTRQEPSFSLTRTASTCVSRLSDRSAQRNKHRRAAERAVTRSLLGANFVFISLTLPLCITLVCRFFSFQVFQDHLTYRRNMLVFAVSYQLACLNSAMNVVVYFVCAPPFKKQLKALIRGKDICGDTSTF